jgi:indolepyruvate ferredoxin oxidoreductase beta subunit
MGDIYNILIAGVGGQGVITLGILLREYGMKNPLIENVVGTETRGVSQREGSVNATVRYLLSNRLYSLDQNFNKEDLISPLIPINDAFLVIGLEPLETLRCLKYISEKTLVILNTRRKYPKNLLLENRKSKEYPSTADIIDILDQFARRVIAIDLNELSQKMYNKSVFANIIALGICAREFKGIFQEKIMKSLINEIFPHTSIDENLNAFDLGYNLINDY